MEHNSSAAGVIVLSPDWTKQAAAVRTGRGANNPVPSCSGTHRHTQGPRHTKPLQSNRYRLRIHHDLNIMRSSRAP